MALEFTSKSPPARLPGPQAVQFVPSDERATTGKPQPVPALPEPLAKAAASFPVALTARPIGELVERGPSTGN